MTYTPISSDKIYSEKKGITFFQEMFSFFVGCVLYAIIFIKFFSNLISTNIVFLSFSISVTLFLLETFQDIIARTITGINTKNETFFRKHKGVGNMLKDYFLIAVLFRTGEVVYVDKNFDGFKKEIIFNLVTSFYVFVVIILLLFSTTFLPKH